MQQRYYEPTAGRFLSVDPVVTDADSGRGFGRYHYAENNPYRYTDPDGRASWETVCVGTDCAGILAEIAEKSKKNRLAWERAVAAGDLDAMQQALEEYESIPGASPLIKVARVNALLRARADAGLTADGTRFLATAATAGFQIGMSSFVAPGAGATTTVIGRLQDLQKLGAGEKSLLDRLPYRGDNKANWQQNAGVLREVMRLGRPIRDASPGDTSGQFLNAERNLLRDHGWTFDAQTNFWMPPKP
jgi:hypothetical protein